MFASVATREPKSFSLLSVECVGSLKIRHQENRRCKNSYHFEEFILWVVKHCYCLDMSKRRTLVACTAVALLTAIGSGSVSADESVPVPTTTTVVEQFDEETGIIWSQIDETTIEVSQPD